MSVRVWWQLRHRDPCLSFFCMCVVVAWFAVPASRCTATRMQNLSCQFPNLLSYGFGFHPSLVALPPCPMTSVESVSFTCTQSFFLRLRVAGCPCCLLAFFCPELCVLFACSPVILLVSYLFLFSHMLLLASFYSLFQMFSMLNWRWLFILLSLAYRFDGTAINNEWAEKNHTHPKHTMPRVRENSRGNRFPLSH